MTAIGDMTYLEHPNPEGWWIVIGIDEESQEAIMHPAYCGCGGHCGFPGRGWGHICGDPRPIPKPNMTDLEKVRAFHDSFGIPYEESIYEPSRFHQYTAHRLEIGAGCCEKVEGYCGFCNIWEFDLNGALIKLLIIE